MFAAELTFPPSPSPTRKGQIATAAADGEKPSRDILEMTTRVDTSVNHAHKLVPAQEINLSFCRAS